MTKLIFCSLIFPTIASAGAISGGGGTGVVCRDGADKIVSAELLDLYEGSVMSGGEVQRSAAPMELQIKAAVEKIPERSRFLIQVYVDKVLKSFRLTPSGAKLMPIKDSFEVVLPRGCAAEQLANYYNDNLVLVSRDLWSALSETDRAALILHEAVYAVNRTVGAVDSRQSRNVVSHLFADPTPWMDIKAAVPAEALNCMASSNGILSLWAYRDVTGGWTLQFQILGGSYVFSKKSISFSGEGLDLNEAKAFPIVRGEQFLGTGIQMTGAAQSLFENGDMISLSKRWEPVKDQQGQIIRGYQAPRYYLSWNSGTYPGTGVKDQLLNCGVMILP